MKKSIFLLGCIMSIIGCTSDNSATTNNLNDQKDWTPKENVTFHVSAEAAMKQALCCMNQASTRATRNLEVESVIPWAFIMDSSSMML